MERTYYRLIYPERLQPNAVEGFIYSVSGMLGRRRFNIPGQRKAVVFEVWGDEYGLNHRIGVTTERNKHLEHQMRSHMPGIQIDEEEPKLFSEFDIVSELGLSSDITPLDTQDPSRVATSLLTSLWPLESGEIALIQWVVSPATRSQPRRSYINHTQQQPHKINKGDGVFLGASKLIINSSVGMQNRISSTMAARAEANQDRIQALAAMKWQGVMFNAICRVGVYSPYGNSSEIHTSIIDALQSISGNVQFIGRSFGSADQINERIVHGTVPVLNWPCLLNNVELSALLALPFEGVNVPGLTVGGSVQTPPPPQIPVDGRVVAYSTYSGTERPLAIPWPETLRHFYLLGKTGSGKSTVLENCAIQDMQRGIGLVYIDPMGESAEHLIDCVPKGREQDVIYFDPANKDAVVGLNLFETGVEDPEIVASAFVGIIKNLFKDEWKGRMQLYLLCAVHSLANVPDVTMLDVIEILANPIYRHKILERYPPSEEIQRTWARFEALKKDEQIAHITPVLTRLEHFSIQPTIRHVIGQPHPALNMPEVIDSRKIVIAKLGKGRLPGDTSPLLGSLLTSMLWAAALKRSITPSTLPFGFYVDEFQDFLQTPNMLREMMAQARGKKISITLANQLLNQLKNPIDRTDYTPDVLTNAASAMYWQLTEDADVIANHYRQYLKPSDFQSLGSHEVIVSISTGSTIRSKPVVAKTYPPLPTTNSRSIVIEHNRLEYAHSCDKVDEEISARRNAFNGAPRGKREVNEDE